MRPRTLLCITVYNGRAFVPAALASAARLDRSQADVDVLVLDDCSPEPGWSEELAHLCGRLGIRYYRSPRNLGIPRNVNLGLLTAMNEAYDYVIISNSDVLYPRTLISRMLQAANHPRVGSVTAWSNNVSIYSLPNADPGGNLADQDVVDWVSESLAGTYAGSAIDIPAGISFCLLIPGSVLREVGLMDPVFGRGYSQETDWTLRSVKMGYRIVLAPGVFVYHASHGSALDTGLQSSGGTTAIENEAIVHLRYPNFATQIREFLGSGILPEARHDALTRIIADAGAQFGYTVEVGWLPRATKNDENVRCLVAPDASPRLRFLFRGFELETEMPTDDLDAHLIEMFGREPDSLSLFDRGRIAGQLRTAMSAKVVDRHAYPTRI